MKGHMQLIELAYRFDDWPVDRPDTVDQIPSHHEPEVRREIKALGGRVTERRTVSWQEQLARMENPEL